jgi:dynein light chain roadblock-type
LVQSEIEDTLKRIQSHKGVLGVVILNCEGIPIRTTLDNNETAQYSALITQLAAKAKSVIRDLDPQVKEKDRKRRGGEGKRGRGV